MKNTVFVVKGITNQGKSQTIKMVYKKLISDPQCEIILPDKGRVDLTTVIKYRGILIGIESQGDPGGRAASSLEKFVELKCRIIVCAARTYGKTVDIVYALEKSGYEIQEILKTGIVGSEAEQQASNDEYAKDIVGKINNLIS